MTVPLKVCLIYLTGTEEEGIRLSMQGRADSPAKKGDGSLK